MRYLIRIGVLCIATMLGAAGNVTPVEAVGAEINQHLLIEEVSPASSSSASEEYVELFNPSPNQVDVTGWQLQYRSASHPSADTGSWSVHAILGCQSAKASECAAVSVTTIGAESSLRLSSYEVGDGAVPLTSGMATTGGEVRLVQPALNGLPEAVIDMVGYGVAKTYEGAAPAPAPLAGRSIIRSQDGQGQYLDTDQNVSDFVLSADETISTPSSGDETTSESSTTQPDSGMVRNYLKAEVTEVFPDPASPQTDDADEFIELYNPYNQALDLSGYTIKTGTDWSHAYTIDHEVLPSFGYISFASSQTHLLLSNSGSGVRLYDPSGTLVFEVPTYGKAKPGYSWIKTNDGHWAWTVRPTPGAENFFDAPEVSPMARPLAKAPVTKAPTATKAKSASTKTSTPRVKGASIVAQKPAHASVGSGSNQAGIWALAGAGVLGLGYALFEYRQELIAFIRRSKDRLIKIAQR